MILIQNISQKIISWDDRDDFGGSGGVDIGAGEGGFRNLIGGYHGDEKTTRYINNSFNAIDNVANLSNM